MSDINPLWAIAASAIHGSVTNIAVFMVRAANKDEAVGKGMRVVQKILPASEGHTSHSCGVCSVNNVVDPDGPLVSDGFMKPFKPELHNA